MAETIKLLIVEDHEPDIQSYKDALRLVNEDLSPEVVIEAEFRKSKEEGLDAIQKMKDELHGAFLDMKLSTGTPVEINEGNEVLDSIYGKLRFPVLVLTNTPNAIEARFKKSIFLKVIAKTDIHYTDAFKVLVEIYKTGILNILGKKGLIEKMLDEIFWENISITLPEWLNSSRNEKPLLRYTLTHIQEHLEVTEDGLGFDNFYPIENYIIPSIKMYFYTGDIVNLKAEKNKRFIILTPACDLAPHGGLPKVKDVLLAEIQPLTEGIFVEKVNAAKKQPSNVEEEIKVANAKVDLEKLIANNFSPKYYYLPNVSLAKGGLINFQKRSTVRIDDLKENYEKEVTIASQFIKDIVAKFSFYYSRQGSPDFDLKKVIEKIVDE
jgi:hypothetical protein